jgi:TonB-dependent receptor
VFGPTAVYGFPVTSALSQLFNLAPSGQPGGTTTQWLVANLPAAAAYTQLYSRTAAPDIGNIRGVQETSKTIYFQTDAKGTIAGLDYALNAGVRYAATEQVTSGLGQAAPIKRKYDDWLPSLNLALFPAQDFIVRAAVAKVMTRPSLGSLSGGTADGFNQRVTQGNPDLEPYRATNYDLSFEWYFGRGAVASVALFKKDVSTFTQSQTISGLTFAQTGASVAALSPSSPAYLSIGTSGDQLVQPIWQLSKTVNGSGASLKGIELALQLPFKVFVDSGLLSNFGILANATFIDSKATFNLQGPATTPGGSLPNVVVTNTLSNVSKAAWNGTFYYDDGRFSGRVMVSYRGRFHEGASGTGNLLEGYGATTNLDASVRYKLTDNLEVSLEGNNLLDTYRYRFTDFDANRNYENNHFGRTILFGARFKY